MKASLLVAEENMVSTLRLHPTSQSQAAGVAADMLMSLLRKERELGIKPDPVVDAYLKARDWPGLRQAAGCGLLEGARSVVRYWLPVQ